jgi:hypothetical protein
MDTCIHCGHPGRAECADGIACLARRREIQAAMERGLADAWRVLDDYLEERNERDSSGV